MQLIEILGPGCPRCDRTTAEIRAVVERAHCEAEVRHVTDPFEIVARGVLFSIPVVLVDGVLVSRGRVPSRAEIERWLDVGSGSAVSPR
jgi:small redox-active disulfide protein 2